MKKIKALISSLLGLTLLFGVPFGAAGCKDKGGNDAEKQSVAFSSDPDQGIDKTKTIGKLVQNAQSDYKILIPTDADECVRYAASELQKYVYQTSGAMLSIVDDAHAQIFLSGKYISLGETALRNVAAFNVDYGGLNEDGFVIKTKESSVYIIAERNSGVLYGVYDFCERILGTRFLTNDYTYIDERDDIVLYKMDRTEIPAFDNRFHYAEQTMQQIEFVTKQRQNPIFNGKKRDEKYGGGGADNYVSGMIGHTVITVLLKKDKYLAEHGDWYADTSGSELCYTNGITPDGTLDLEDTDSMAMEMLKVCKERILANDTGADTIFIGQEDNGAWCGCDKCVESDKKYDGKSGTLITFCNVIAKELEEWNEEEQLGKDITVETFAYWKTLDPPGKIDQDGVWKPTVTARKNVAVMFAWMGCGMHALEDACTANITHASRFNRWQLCADKLTIWDYVTNFSSHFFWYENFDSLAKNYRFYYENGVTRIMSQGAPHVSNYYQGHLENYVVAKLLWNPWLDTNELINEFNYYYYGADSYKVVNEFVQYMRAYYKILDQSSSTGFHTELYTHGPFLNAENYTLSFLTGAINLLQKEIDRVNEDQTLSAEEKAEQIKRLWQVQIQPEYMLLHNYEFYYDPIGKKDFAKSWFSKTDVLNIKYYNEGGSIAELKTALGVS